MYNGDTDALVLTALIGHCLEISSLKPKKKRETRICLPSHLGVSRLFKCKLKSKETTI